MPKDKRLLITKAVLAQVQKKALDPKAPRPEATAVKLQFVAPVKALQQDSTFATKLFQMSNATYSADGQTSVLIVPQDIHLDCIKINKRYSLYDAVVAIESIAAGSSDPQAQKRAVQVATTFRRFVVDSRAVRLLPRSVTSAVERTKTAGVIAAPAKPSTQQAAQATQISAATKTLTVLPPLQDKSQLVFHVTQGAKGSQVDVAQSGLCTVRVGHGGLGGGEVAENAKAFIAVVRQQYPQVYKHILDFKLVTDVTEPIRFMEAHFG